MRQVFARGLAVLSRLRHEGLEGKRERERGRTNKLISGTLDDIMLL